MDSATGCPDDYEELFRSYFPMMKAVVSRSGIEAADVEDVTMDILARFIDKDGLAYYDPDRLHDVGESPNVPGARFRKAKFSSMLRGFTATYVMQYRDKQMTRHRREPWRLEKPVYTQGKREVTWYEATFDGKADSLNAILDTEVSLTLMAALKQARKTLEPSVRNYDRFIDLCVTHGYLDGRLDRKAVGAEMGVSQSTVTVMLREFRAVLRPILAEAGVVSPGVA